ncbi:MAG: hypothetical protein PHQ59_00050 [Candidatus Daviesbacteria bacterium]|nr:hypothetical protein [Candidatus Daviesbacteria bacterium]
MKKSREEVIFKKIKKILEFVWNSPYSSFYKDKYTKAGINLIKDINSMEDFKKLPYLTREDFINSDPFDRFYLPIDKFKLYSISSGTTSENRVVILRANELNARTKKMSQKAVELGVKSCMIFLVPVIYLDSLEIRHKSINRYLANLYNMPSTAMLMSKLRVDSMIISPSNLTRLLPHLEKFYDLKKIKYISMGGEYRSSERLSYFKEKFPNAYFNLKYAATGVGGMGRSCKYLVKQSPQLLHPRPHLYYEFINPKEESELVVTHLDNSRELPLIRYKTGDMVKSYIEDCQCGEKEVIKVFGRIGTDVIKAGGIYFYPEPIDDLIVSQKDILDISNWKLHIYEKDKKNKLPRLHFQLMLGKGINKSSAKKKIVKAINQKLFFESMESLEELVKQKRFLPIEVEFVQSIEYVPPKNINIIYHQ